MAQLTGAELVDEVQELVGRSDNPVLVDNTRCTRWLNEGQEEIVNKTPGLICREVRDATTFYCISDTVEYSFASFCSGLKVCHPLQLKYINGNESYDMSYMPQDEFDEEYPDPTHSDYSPQKPVNWTRKGNSVFVAPRPSSDYIAAAAGDTTGVFKFWYTAYAEDFTTDDADESDITRADKGLILYGVAEAWGAIGEEGRRLVWKRKFDEWLEDYQAKNAMMQAWDANILLD